MFWTKKENTHQCLKQKAAVLIAREHSMYLGPKIFGIHSN